LTEDELTTLVERKGGGKDFLRLLDVNSGENYPPPSHRYELKGSARKFSTMLPFKPLTDQWAENSIFFYKTKFLEN